MAKSGSDRLIGERRGIKRSYWRDFYHRLLTTSWTRFLFGFVAIYLCINIGFACAYYVGGDCVSGVGTNRFGDLFFFSIETFSTIGYGGMAPSTTYAHSIASLEAIIGTIASAILTGLTFAKFARPSARVLFSNQVLITEFEGRPALMLRMANERANQIVEASLRLTVVLKKMSASEEDFRYLVDLKLRRSETPVFALSWTAVHFIDEDSPLWGFSKVELERHLMSLIASFMGTDEDFNHTVHARHVYLPEDFDYGRRFVDIISFDESGLRVVDYSLFHETKPHSLSRKNSHQGLDSESKNS